jgi:hypothetical protein
VGHETRLVVSKAGRQEVACILIARKTFGQGRRCERARRYSDIRIAGKQGPISSIQADEPFLVVL